MVRTNAAARLLGVSANTLRSWERRYGFPRPGRTAGGHRQYALAEIEALKLALDETENVSSAVALARRRGVGPPSSARLAAAFASFDEALADRLLEESLALRSVERTVEEVLLPAVIDHSAPPVTATFEFASRHAAGWLWAQKRLAAPTTASEGVLILDAGNACDVDSLGALALELVLRRAGLRTLTLSSASGLRMLGSVVRALRPVAVILADGGAGLDEMARSVYAIRHVAPGLLVLDSGGETPFALRDALLSSMRRRDVAQFVRPLAA
jgi:transposase-like protein